MYDDDHRTSEGYVRSEESRLREELAGVSAERDALSREAARLRAAVEAAENRCDQLVDALVRVVALAGGAV